MLIVCAHLIIALALIGVFGGKNVNIEDEDWLQQSNSIRDLLMGIICLIVSILLFVVCCLGCFAVCCRWCPCLILLTPFTIAVGLFLLAIGSLADNLDNLIDEVCEETEDEIREFWNGVIDVPMCSDICPCDSVAFVAGGYDDISNYDLSEFGRSELYQSGDDIMTLLAPDVYQTVTDKMPLFTQEALEDFTANGGAFSTVTAAVLASGVGTTLIGVDPYNGQA